MIILSRGNFFKRAYILRVIEVQEPSDESKKSFGLRPLSVPSGKDNGSSAKSLCPLTVTLCTKGPGPTSETVTVLSSLISDI
jgi:hypothetical protein